MAPATGPSTVRAFRGRTVPYSAERVSGYIVRYLASFIVLPCTLRKSIAVLLRSALGVQAIPHGTGRKGGHGIPVPRHRREILHANGASSIRILGQGSGHLMGIVAPTCVLAVMDVGRVGPGRGTTLAPTSVLGATRAALTKATQEAIDAPTILAGGTPTVAGLLATNSLFSHCETIGGGQKPPAENENSFGFPALSSVPHMSSPISSIPSCIRSSVVTTRCPPVQRLPTSAFYTHGRSRCGRELFLRCPAFSRAGVLATVEVTLLASVSGAAFCVRAEARVAPVRTAPCTNAVEPTS